MGSGIKSLILMILRESILTLLFAYLFAFVLNMGAFGVYLGLVAGLSLGSIISFMVVKIYCKKLKEYETASST